jgi:hypothetical protein
MQKVSSTTIFEILLILKKKYFSTQPLNYNWHSSTDLSLITNFLFPEICIFNNCKYSAKINFPLYFIYGCPLTCQIFIKAGTRVDTEFREIPYFCEISAKFRYRGNFLYNFKYTVLCYSIERIKLKILLFSHLHTNFAVRNFSKILQHFTKFMRNLVNCEIC